MGTARAKPRKRTPKSKPKPEAKPKAKFKGVDPAQSPQALAEFGKAFELALERLFPNAIASTKRRR
jgi:hypothetical protein